MPAPSSVALGTLVACRPPQRPACRVSGWGVQRNCRSFKRRCNDLERRVGSVVWIEGEAGIGKSSLTAMGTAAARAAGFNTLWGTADEMSGRIPFRVMLDCLQVTPRSADPRRAEVARALRDPPGLLSLDDRMHDQVEVLVALADELCTEHPTVMVVDDLQWADEMSLLVWHRLAQMADQLPLLLVAACHPVSPTSRLREIRAGVRRRGDSMILLGPLDDESVVTLVTTRLGVEPGPALSRLTAQAMGNPLYLQELLDALVREAVLAELASGELPESLRDRIPASLSAALNDRLSLLPKDLTDVLRTAALLGGSFAVADLAAVVDKPTVELAAIIQDAVGAGIIIDAGDRMAFQSPLIRQALYDGIPRPLREWLHAEAAKSLAHTGAEATLVAEQLMESGRPGESWARSWLAASARQLAARAPGITAVLLQREVDVDRPDDGIGSELAAALASVLLGLGKFEDAAAYARQTMTGAVDPQGRAEMHWVLTRALFGLGRYDDAAEAVRGALDSPWLPDTWRARLLASQAMFLRAGGGDIDAADRTARQAQSVAEVAGDRFATAYALTDLWYTEAIRRNHVGALDCLERAFAALGDTQQDEELRAFASDARIFTLQNLSRWADAEASLHSTEEQARRAGNSARPAPAITAAVLMYWMGRWDDALAELGDGSLDPSDLTYAGLRERGPALLWHGVAALIALRRNDRATGASQLRAGLALPIQTIADRENRDFLVAAHALEAEQSREPARALSLLSSIVDPGPGEMTLIHQWLPSLVRVSMEVGDDAAVMGAVAACRREADAESIRGRAYAAAQWCEGLADSDPARLGAAVEHYRRSGPLLELAMASEDLAVVLARAGAHAEARACFNEATSLYSSIGAEWDIRRADSRLRAFDIRRGVRGQRARPASGWDSLTRTELTVAAMVADGLATSSIASDLFLSPRTVQCHISHILTKLNVRGRMQIATEFYRHTDQGPHRRDAA